MPFPYVLPMDPAQKLLSAMPLVIFYPGVLACVAGAGLLGSVIGRGLPVDRESKDVTSYGVAALAGAGAVYAGYQAKKKRDSAAVVELYNAIVELPDPSALTDADVLAVGNKYGISMRKDALERMQKIYETYLESLIPSGDTQLRGDEADKARGFKEALGLTDEEAAPAHIEVAKRMYRGGFETKNRQQQYEQRKAFQRLIYVSQLVFGDQKAAFLLPWRKNFNLTEAQIFVARRDNAKTIFKSLFEVEGGDLKADRHFLRELRDKQLAVRMMDESAEEVIKEFARRHIEGCMMRAMEATRATGKGNKDLNVLVKEIQHVVEYNRSLVKMADEEDLVPGLGHVSIKGGVLASEGRTREVKDLYRAYLDEQMERQGGISIALEQEAKDLQSIFNLGSKDAQVIRDEVAAKLYKRLLKEEVTSGRLDAAPSPAAVLQGLCEKVRFGPEAAFELHKQLYRGKMMTLVDKGRLTDADAADLKRIRRILCISDDMANQVAKDVVGKSLMEVFDDIFAPGVRPVSENELRRVERVMKDLAITPEVGTLVLAQAAREKFRGYVKESQKEKEDRKVSAGHMRRMVQFNALVVTPILERIKGVEAASKEKEKEAAMKELADIMAKAAEEAKKEGASDDEIAAATGDVRTEGDADAAPKEVVTADAIMEEEGSSGGREAAPPAAPKDDAGAGAQEVVTADAVLEQGVPAAAAEAVKETSDAEAAKPEESVTAQKAKAKEETIKQVQKAIQASRGEFGDDEKKGQKEINLKEDVDENMRADIYKNYLMYTMTGDVVELPVGGMVRKKNNANARETEMARLSQLADILGMGQMEIIKAQQDLAEQAYKGQVNDVLRSGPLNQEKMQYLEQMRGQLGISKEAGDRVLKETRTEVYGASASTLEDGGRWTLDRIMEVTKAGGSIDGQIEEVTRRNIFRKELQNKISDGSGDLDADFIIQQLPKMLSLEERKIKQIVKELVASRKRTLLVQAVSQYRQRRPAETVMSLQNLISCTRALPEEQPMPWNERAELRDVFQAYCSDESSLSKRAELQKILGLTDEEALELGAASEVDVGEKKTNFDDDLFF